ncbi:MAG: class I SAM-dependent methyltransferase [Rhodocyclales bacterium]|nr:class I SAM-dependent methyltransferase [Rhodocyclales bacterium]
MQLDEYRRRWESKPALRAVYADLHRRMSDAAVSGPGLEIGAGIGNLASGCGNLLRMDIQCSPGVDLAADAHRLPFADASFTNIFLFDVLHHLQCPLRFFAEADRVLRVGGRVIMVEPGITPVSGMLYRLGHEEPVDLGWQPDPDCVPDPGKDPYASNQAIPTILFKRSPDWIAAAETSLQIREARWLSLVVYPLTGGFKSWSMMPSACVAPLLRLEDLLLPMLGGFMGFRLMVVLEKT